MLTVHEAEKIISQNLIDLTYEVIPTMEAWRRILGEEIRADRDFPPFDRATMDGIAINYNTWQGGQKKFKIQATQFAGTAPLQLENSQNCIEIMTGAVLSLGSDTVIRFEDVEITQENEIRWAEIKTENIDYQQNIHFQGIDKKQNDLLIKTGTRLDAPEIAVAVSVGKSHLKVKSLPKIAIISNGDELVAVDETPLPHQIRRSNVYALASALAERKIKAELYHFADDKTLIEKGLAKILTQFDIIILSGGVSQGYADFIPQILTDLGVEKLFHQVKQRPGKPFWFGKKANKVVFALPGNPVSTIACFYRYTLPYIEQILGVEKSFVWQAQLSEDFVFKPNLTYFLPVQIKGNSQGILLAKPESGHGSGDFTNLLACDGFLELPDNQTHFKAGESFPLYWFR